MKQFIKEIVEELFDNLANGDLYEIVECYVNENVDEEIDDTEITNALMDKLYYDYGPKIRD